MNDKLSKYALSNILIIFCVRDDICIIATTKKS